jgi:hypothetical protein
MDYSKIPYNLYVIRLEDERYFIHVQSAETLYDANPDKIMNNCVLLYDYVKQYKPKEIADIVYQIDFLYIDRFVLNYMQMYGIDYVRGGSYTDLVLPEYLLLSLSDQFKTMTSLPYEIQSKINNIDTIQVEKPEKPEKSAKSNQEIQQLKDHHKSINEFDYIKTKDELIWLKHHILDILDMDILYSSSQNGQLLPLKDAKIHKQSVHKRYTELLQKMKRLPYIYEKVLNFTGKEINPTFIDKRTQIYLKNPEFAFDNFVYHANTPNYKRIDSDEWAKHFGIIEHLFYIIYNHLCEVEFDISNPNL